MITIEGLKRAPRPFHAGPLRFRRRDAKGTILKTTDGGETWIAKETGVAVILRGVTFVDVNNGWVVGTNGTILHTNDGGGNWTGQFSGTVDEFMGAAFVDSLNGWGTSIRTTHYDMQGEQDNWQGSIWHTDNGGETWKELYNAGLEITLKGVDFADKNNGWVVGFPTSSSLTGGFVFHTADGGATWNRQKPGDIFAPL